MLHRVGLAPTISVHARGEVIAGSSRALLLKLPVHGAGERARTVDLLITNQLLCQLSYTSKNGYRRTRVYFNCSCLCLLCCRTTLPSQSRRLISYTACISPFGCRGGIRTHDLLAMNQTSCQLLYSAIFATEPYHKLGGAKGRYYVLP